MSIIYLYVFTLQEADFKLNVRLFNVFLRKETAVFESSPKYQGLPDDESTSTPRKRSAASAVSSDSPGPTKVKRTYKVSQEFTDSDEE